MFLILLNIPLKAGYHYHLLSIYTRASVETGSFKFWYSGKIS